MRAGCELVDPEAGSVSAAVALGGRGDPPPRSSGSEVPADRSPIAVDVTDDDPVDGLFEPS
jgi:hypothetical protein